MNDLQYFEIQAEEPGKTAEFYATVVGWKCTRDPNPPIEYWRMETGGIGGAVLKRPAPVPAPRSGTNAYVCSMEVEDFDVTAEKSCAAAGRLPWRSLPFRGSAGKDTL